MSKRKSNKPRKPVAAKPAAEEPALVPQPIVAVADVADHADVAGHDGEVLHAVPEIDAPLPVVTTETRLPERAVEEVVTTLPPVPPPDLEATPLPPDRPVPEPEPAAPVMALARMEQAVRPATGVARIALAAPRADFKAGLKPQFKTGLPVDGATRALAGIEACQALFVEVTRNNLDLAVGLVGMSSPVDMFGLAARFAGRQIDITSRFTKTLADIAIGRSVR